MMAVRLDTAGGKSDLSDILHLMSVVAIKDKRELIEFAAAFYPEARISGRLMLGINQIWSEWTKGQPGGPDAPSYLGRRGPAP